MPCIAIPPILKRYFSYKWKIFPIYAPVQNKCSCNNPNCSSPAKHPLVFNSFRSATNNVSLIQTWLNKYPLCNWAIATGRSSNLIIVDVDLDKNGGESIKLLKIPATYTVLSGNGYHYYFSLPPKYHNLRSFTAILPGVDIKANGGYIIAPPSTHINGHQYEIYLDMPPVPFPNSILKLILSKNNPDNKIFPGNRNTSLFRIGLGFAYNHAITYKRLLKYLEIVNQDRCYPPIETDELKTIANNILKLISRRTTGLSSYKEILWTKK